MPVGEDGEFLEPREFARHLRNNSTPAEKTLWDELKNSKLGFKFRRQLKLDEKTYVDFACTAVKLIVEVDGAAHDNREDWDAAREVRIEALGFVVMRFRNHEILSHPKRVAEQIRAACEARPRWRY